MNIDDFIDAQKKTLSLFHENTEKFQKIRKSTQSLIDRWQEFIGIVLPIQISVIQTYGYPKDQKGLSEFNQQLMELSSSSQALKECNEEKWRFLFENAFGLTEYKKVSLSEAQKLIEDIANAMVAHQFLEEIDKTFEQLDTSMSVPMKRQKLLEILLPLHMSVMSEHGFIGENGYIQAQRALMDYYFDPFISERSSYAQKIVFQRAKLL